MKAQRFPSWLPPVAVGFGVLVVALVGWFALVAPQKSKAKSLTAQIESTQKEITDLRLLARPVSDAQTVKVADVFRLSKAMPAKVDMPGIILELNRIAGESGISFDLLTPKAPSTVNGIETVQIDLAFKGTFFDLSDFVYRLRNLVRVQRGRLAATGRLFTVESLTFTKSQDTGSTDVNADESTKVDPNRIEASLSINAYVYTGAVPDASAGAGTTGTDTTSTDTTTTTEAPPPAGEAAGVTP